LKIQAQSSAADRPSFSLFQLQLQLKDMTSSYSGSVCSDLGRK
jgi:hypothetical protein